MADQIRRPENFIIPTYIQIGIDAGRAGDMNAEELKAALDRAGIAHKGVTKVDDLRALLTGAARADAGAPTTEGGA